MGHWPSPALRLSDSVWRPQLRYPSELTGLGCRLAALLLFDLRQQALERQERWARAVVGVQNTERSLLVLGVALLAP